MGMSTLVVGDVSDRCNGQKDKEDLDEVSNELELVDEDDTIPYKALPLLCAASSWLTLF